MSNRLLAVEEEGVGGPNVAGQEVVQWQPLHWPFEAKTLVLPALTEEHINGVFLEIKKNKKNVQSSFKMEELQDIWTVQMLLTKSGLLLPSFPFHPHCLAKSGGFCFFALFFVVELTDSINHLKVGWR